MPGALFWDVCSSPLHIAWSWARTPRSCGGIFLIGLLWMLRCIFFSPLTPPHHRVCQMFWSKWEICLHYSLDLLCSSFPIQAPLRAGILPCPPGYALGQDPYMCKRWRCTFYFTIGNAGCSKMPLLGRGLPDISLALKMCTSFFSALPFRMPESFTEVVCPWIFTEFVFQLPAHVFLTKVSSPLAVSSSYRCDGSMWSSSGCPDGPDLSGLY